MVLRGFYSLDALGTYFSQDHDSLDDLALYTVRWSRHCTLLSVTPAVGCRQSGPDFASWSAALSEAGA